MATGTDTRTTDVADRTKATNANPHVLIIVQNLPVPLDRRVWLECQALIANGYEVSVICPKGPGDPRRQVIDGVHIYKYRPAPEAKGLLGFVIEFVYCWILTALLSREVWRRRPFQVLQACNPPDTYWLLARLWRRRGVRFLFDHHDLNPELFLSRFGLPTQPKERLELYGLRWLEQMTFRTAERVVSTNESYRAVALGRGQRHPDHVTVVRSGPDTRRMRPIYPDVPPEAERRFSLVYLGIMGPQDGVNVVLELMAELVHHRGRRDVHATLLGFGDCYEALRQQATEFGIDPWVTFTGRADQFMIADHLSRADIGLCPDPKTPLNDISTMNKTMEYMAYALPSVSFDLVETRITGEDTVVYVEPGNVSAFADAVEQLLDTPQLRLELGYRARQRVAMELDWRPQSAKYIQVIDELCGRVASREPVLSTPEDRRETDPRGRSYVDLDDVVELRRFIVDRSVRPVPAAPSVPVIDLTQPVALDIASHPVSDVFVPKALVESRSRELVDPSNSRSA